MKPISAAAGLLALVLGAPAAAAQTSADPGLPPLGGASAVLQLRSELNHLLDSASTPGTAFSALVVSLDRGDTLYSRAPDLPLAPASNMKIYTTGAALYYLGPDFRYSTSLLIDGEVRGGVLHGDVILRGTGDPAISDRLMEDATLPLVRMADALRGMGVEVIAGDVVGDGSWFDPEWVAPAWEDDDLLSWYAAPVGGLNFAENMVRVRVLPGASGGEPARIVTTPATAGLALHNRVTTTTSGATRVSFGHGPGAIVVTGSIRRGHGGVRRTMPVVDPANYAAAALRSALETRGIRVLGQTRSGAHPARRPRVVAEHRSPPLSKLATVTNHASHNLFAEALLKTLGRTVAGAGSFAAGADAVQRFISAEAPVGPGQVVVVDGSGLSRPNRATTGATVALLDYIWRSDLAAAFFESLPEAGDADGLKRMYGTAAASNLRAKTGTIREVSALSGYLTAANGEALVFSIISNGVSASWRSKAVEDSLAVRLAEFTR